MDSYRDLSSSIFIVITVEWLAITQLETSIIQARTDESPGTYRPVDAAAPSFLSFLLRLQLVPRSPQQHSPVPTDES